MTAITSLSQRPCLLPPSGRVIDLATPPPASWTDAFRSATAARVAGEGK